MLAGNDNERRQAHELGALASTATASQSLAHYRRLVDLLRTRARITQLARTSRGLDGAVDRDVFLRLLDQYFNDPC